MINSGLLRRPRVVCNACGAKAKLWEATLPGSGWRATAHQRGTPEHYCPNCRLPGSYVHLSGGPA